jgi:MoxR-like ATPase
MSVFTQPSFDLDTVPEKDRARVAALIPDPRIAAGYVHRQVNGWDDFDLLDGLCEEMENIILAGPTGSSKTTLFRSYAAARGLPFVVVECNAAMDPGTIIGRTTIGPDGAVEWVDGDMTLVIRYGGVVLIDEINMAHPRVTAAWHGVLSVMRAMSLPENGEVIRAGRGGTGERQPVLIGAAYNPHYQGTVRLNEALGNRYPAPFKWDYDREVESQLVKSPRLLDMAGTIRNLAEIRSPVSTNMLQEFVRHANKFDMAMAEYWFVNHFSDAEQGPVSRALEANSAAIARELGVQPIMRVDGATGTSSN